MPHDPEAFASMVIMTVKSALAPVLERLAASEQKNRDLESRVLELSGLRDRVTVVETKAAMVPAPAVLEAQPAVDLTSVLERIQAAEMQVKSLESRPVVDVDALDKRVNALELRLTAAELKADIISGERARIGVDVADLTKDIGAMRERVAVMEVRAQVPGPAGKDGADGQPGKDGADGLGWDDLTVVQDDERTFTVKAARGERVKSIGTVRFPVFINRGVYEEGKTYTQGDMTTWGGSSWHCETETTTKPGESKDWTLIVKRGRDGRDGKDAPQAPPVVSVKR